MFAYEIVDCDADAIACTDQFTPEQAKAIATTIFDAEIERKLIYYVGDGHYLYHHDYYADLADEAEEIARQAAWDGDTSLEVVARKNQHAYEAAQSEDMSETFWQLVQDAADKLGFDW